MKPVPPADLWAQMDALIGNSDPPEGAVSLMDIMARYGIKRDRARHAMDRMMDDGKAEFCGSFHGKNYYTFK